jgi:polynucleotide 5'-hydroxyl-kinase GRC3/NOL9
MKVRYVSRHKVLTNASAKNAQRFVVLGSFGIKVLHGEVTLAGATLRASENTFWVHAPQCLALPVIRTTEESRLELHNDPTSRGLRKLGRLSPLFRRIWNESGDTADGTVGGENTFQIVCMRVPGESNTMTD